MNWSDYQKLLWATIKDENNNLKEKIQNILNNSRCPKCVYQGECYQMDIDGDCKRYKRDPPDGGYYG